MQTAVKDPHHASPAQLLEIQRLYGNRAVQHILSGSAFVNPQTVSRGSQPGSLQGGPLGSRAQSQIDSARGGGAPLDRGVGAQVGGALGADFSAVKVHTDTKADALNRSLSAKAFTTGSDIFFSKGAYRPNTSSGKHLLAHELTHVMQQGGAKPNKASPEQGRTVQAKHASVPIDKLDGPGPNSAPPHISAAGRSPAIRRTVWRYRGAAWVQETTDPSDADAHDDPDTHCLTNGITPGERDKYDQDTGTYYSWADAREKTRKRATAKKRPGNYGGFFDESRETTPYGYFKPRGAGEKRSKPQGPHLLAHVTKRTVFDMAQNMGLAPDSILGSKLAPKPRQALQMMEDQLAARGLAASPGAISTWYRDYKRAYLKGEAQKPGWKQGVKQAMELHPLTTYRVGEVAGEAELAGKDESASVAMGDIDMLVIHPRTGGLPGGLTTVDTEYAGEGWGAGDPLREDFMFNYAHAATGRPPSPSPYAEAPMSPPHNDDW